jgi:hypothetical protein
MHLLTHRDGYAGEEEVKLVPPLPPRLSILLLLLTDLRYTDREWEIRRVFLHSPLASPSSSFSSLIWDTQIENER